ncbi:MAG TPA: 3-isopropylmalate dehydrogenase [Negativicutes bacterium]|nr:3-isopropylmalate dehydrogenase [Negativicutes bacterium]
MKNKEIKITVIPGDGIGPEVTEAAIAVLKAAASRTDSKCICTTYLAGGAAIDAHGVPLPEETIAAARAADAVLLGAVGGPKWDAVAPEIRPEKAILGLRKALGLFANLRPVKVTAAMAPYSPLKTERVTGVDILILRELNGGIYYGTRCESELVNGVEQAWDTELYSVPEVDRIVRMACHFAQGRRSKVTSVDKANVLASSRLWRRTATKIAADYPSVKLEHMYVDNCAMQLVMAPKALDVVVTGNLFGDILTDEAAVITGSIGMLPSASLGAGTGLYEPIHGSAPDIAGKGIANPLGTILSTAMMFRHSLDNEPAAKLIEIAVEKVLSEGYRTADMIQEGLVLCSTSEMGHRVEREITKGA